MIGMIDGFNFVEMEAMKYWAVPASQASRQKEIVNNAIYSGDYMAALKVDGYYERIVKDEDGNCFMIARNRDVHGNVINKIDWLPQINPWLDSLPNGTCLLCECYRPGEEGSKGITSILGCLKEKAIQRQKDSPLHLYVFDCIAFNGESFMETPYEERAQWVSTISNTNKSDFVEYATYYKDEEIWPMLQEYLAAGREGMVLMRKDAQVYEKRTPARVSIKVKKELSETIDCVVIGANAPTEIYTGKELVSWLLWRNDRTGEKVMGKFYQNYFDGEPYTPLTKTFFNGWAGSFKIGLYKDGKLIHFGDVSGITDEMKENWKSYINKVCTVGGMEVFKETGAIRHPKLLGWRDDKKPEECTWEQINE